MVNYSILENPPPFSNLWNQWKNLVDSEGWTVDDNATTTLIPLLKTTRSVFAVDEDNNFIGCVIWNEYDDICWLGYFLLLPEFRGVGIGSKIWALAMDKYSKELVLSLRGVPAMAEKYKSQDCPVSGPILRYYRIKTTDFRKSLKFFEDLDDLKIQKIRDLNPLEFRKFLDYDRKVSGRDRSEFLELYYKKCESTVGFQFLNPKILEIKGIISMAPTSNASENLYKISHLYADSDDVAFFAMKTIVDFIFHDKNEGSTVVLHTVDGFDVVKKFLDGLNVENGISGYTLHSEEYNNHGDLKKVYLPHNSSCHFDY